MEWSIFNELRDFTFLSEIKISVTDMDWVCSEVDREYPFWFTRERLYSVTGLFVGVGGV